MVVADAGSEPRLVGTVEEPGVVGDRLGLVPVGLGAGEEDTPAGLRLVGVGTAPQAVRADAAPMAARTVRARDNLIISEQPFWRALGRLLRRGIQAIHQLRGRLLMSRAF